MAPFEGVAPNIVGTVVTLVVFGAVALPLRIHVRASNDAWGWDDWFMVAAAVPWAALSAICIGGALHGIGVSEAKLTLEERQTALMVRTIKLQPLCWTLLTLNQWFWLFEVFWCISVIPVKLSISFMLGRIAVAKRPYVIGLYFMSALLTIMTLLGKCQPDDILASVYYSTTAVNIAIDWYCALLPVPLLWDAPLSLRNKLSVGFLLSLGVLASVSACVRQGYTAALTSSHDVTYSLGNLVIWGYAEVGIGFTVGSLSTLRPLFSRSSGPGGADQEVNRAPQRDRRSRMATADIDWAGEASHESERDLVQDSILLEKR
ncbi:hypothetical protein LTR65_010326 [Meristemomyces frigidus]